MWRKTIWRRFTPLLNPDFAKFIVDENDKLIAFGLAAPSLAKAIKCARAHVPVWMGLSPSQPEPSKRSRALSCGGASRLSESGLAALLMKRDHKIGH
jgi:hypothetical protein